jgi:hypothetical protein
VQNLAFFILPDFKNHRIQPVAHPADGQELLWNVGSLIEPIGLREQLTRLFKPYATPGFARRRALFRRSKLKRI